MSAFANLDTLETRAQVHNDFLYPPVTNFPIDINECNGDLLPCGDHAWCDNTEGGYSCRCHPGYTGSPCIGKGLTGVECFKEISLFVFQM